MMSSDIEAYFTEVPLKRNFFSKIEEKEFSFSFMWPLLDRIFILLKTNCARLNNIEQRRYYKLFMIHSTACFFFFSLPRSFFVFFAVCEFIIIKLHARTGHFTTFPHSLSVKKGFCARAKKNTILLIRAPCGVFLVLFYPCVLIIFATSCTMFTNI